MNPIGVDHIDWIINASKASRVITLMMDTLISTGRVLVGNADILRTMISRYHDMMINYGE